ncbi:hypothetical protein AOCH_001138 [Aspergillus ochraceoroseus]|uniref:Zn(2)-C6 fungal-type domain-containing protein n=1 Tax=Aspergillus ochraceoroseus TaxID=138278 RepID=A0A0F8UT07_9EURO|nr:hypothetical protein AOCH_001138 [Aspergillus ochraceoroseus]
MPRRKADDRTGPVKTRSRAGCSACRASRVRCDTKKPVCTRCQEKGLSCSTQLVLKWESEFVRRGVAFGRAGVWSKSKVDGKGVSTPSPSGSRSPSRGEHDWCLIPPVESWGFINNFAGAFERPYAVDIERNECTALVPWGKDGDDLFSDGALQSIMGQLARPTAPLPLFPHLSGSNHGNLLEYYVRQVCPRTTASSSSPSPFASAVLPFCLTASPTLFKAIQALGACYRSRFNPSYAVIGLRLKSEAIKGLRNQLATTGPLGGSSDPETLLVMMMLCLYELADHCDERWTIHLKGAKELIRLRRQQAIQPSPSQEPVTAFAEQFFAFHDVMGRTACGEKALFGDDYWHSDDRKVDCWMGCSPELVSILSTVTELSHSRRQQVSDTDRAAFSLKAATLDHQLEELAQQVDDEEDDLRPIAELRRLSALLYLHCALHNASPSTTIVVSYVRRILKLVSEMLDAGSLVGLAWPVFVAGVELDPLNDVIWKDADGSEVYGRPLVLRALAAMAESSVSSVSRTRAVISKVWQTRDNDILKGAPRNEVVDDPSSSNDWEWYVAPVSAAMSLA